MTQEHQTLLDQLIHRYGEPYAYWLLDNLLKFEQRQRRGGSYVKNIPL